MVRVDYHKCVGCKKCYTVCPMDVIQWDEKRELPEITYPEECWFCGCCWMECPKRAIDITFPASYW